MNGDMAFVSMETISKIIDMCGNIQCCERCRDYATKILSLLGGE